MNWFRRKKGEENTQLEQLQKDITSISGRLEEMEESINKLTRVQFKTSKKTKEELDNIGTSITSMAEWKPLIAQNNQLKMEQEIVRKQLMGYIDELDHALSGMSAKDTKWKDVLSGWADDLKQSLETFGVSEIRVLGTTFDPRISESVKTVRILQQNNENHVPYEVVEVYKRGFVAEDGKLIRKAIVATVKEDSGNDGKK